MSRQPTQMIDQGEDRAIAALSKLKPNLAVLKMENDSIMAAALAHPRDPIHIIEQLKSLYEASPKLAERARYAKPVGKVEVCPKCLSLIHI